MDARSRREYLKQYIVACVRDNALSWNDFANPHKFLGVLSSDVRLVLRELGRDSAIGLFQFGAAMLGGLAAKWSK